MLGDLEEARSYAAILRKCQLLSEGSTYSRGSIHVTSTVGMGFTITVWVYVLIAIILVVMMAQESEKPTESTAPAAVEQQVEDDDEPDEWDKRIIKTGCADENLALQLCFADKGDWRQCAQEMATFRKCWADHQNNERTKTKDNDMSDF